MTQKRSAHLVVLAAGQGSRMNSDRPKVLHEIGSAPLFVHALMVGATLTPDRTILVVGHGADAVRAAAHAFDPDVTVIEQSQQLGTGHAVLQARDALSGATGDVVVLYGDTPFIRPETLIAITDARAEGADVVVLGFHADDPGRYGRLITDDDTVTAIVEYNDSKPEERAIKLCNSGVICADADHLFALLDAVEPTNAAGEYYLTDIVELAHSKGLKTGFVTCPQSETLGINTRAELAAAETIFQHTARQTALERGVSLAAPDSVYFAYDTHLGRDCVIEQNVVFGPGVTVETGARIRAFSHLEGAHVGQGAVIGPYARLRPGTELGNSAKVGNFVEVKAAQIGEGAKINHLSYVGDATVGAAANLGAGTITCNYDGVFKHHTNIGDNAFIGSNTMLVAPVSVGAEAMTASGSVITENVPDGALAVGRARQVNKAGLARRFFDKLRTAKAAQKKDS